MTPEQSTTLLMKECELASGIIMRYRELEGWMQRQFALVWCSLMGVGYQMGNPNLHLLAGLATLIVWYWDARYVAKRRAMRRRYEAVATALAQKPDTASIPDPLSLHSEESAGDLRAAVFSRPLAIFYGATIAVSVFVWVVQAFLRAAPGK
jgi:hypothetical protein